MTTRVTIDRNGKRMSLPASLRAQPSPLAGRDLNVSGMIIGKSWRLDDDDRVPSGTLIIDFVEPGSLAESTRASAWSYILSVDGKPYTDIDQLRAVLASKPADAAIKFVTSTHSDASEFTRMYHYIELPRGELKVVTVQ